jgi:hypothetical protein
MSDLPLFSWQPPEKLVIFPTVRNRAKIHRTALAAAASKNPENTIRATIDRARVSFQRKGLPADLISKDMAELEGALRDQVEFLRRRHEVAR